MIVVRVCHCGGVRSSTRMEGTTLVEAGEGTLVTCQSSALSPVRLQDVSSSLYIHGTRWRRSELAVTSTIIFHA